MNDEHVVWSSDVVESHQIYIKDTELDLAKEKMIHLFYEWDGNFTQLRSLLRNM